jgi:hypothetical protein
MKTRRNSRVSLADIKNIENISPDCHRARNEGLADINNSAKIGQRVDALNESRRGRGMRSCYIPEMTILSRNVGIVRSLIHTMHSATGHERTRR